MVGLFIDFAALFVVDDEGAEVDPEVVFEVGDKVEEVVIGTEKDNVGCPDAWLQNCWASFSAVDTWLEQFVVTQARSRPVKFFLIDSSE